MAAQKEFGAPPAGGDGEVSLSGASHRAVLHVRQPLPVGGDLWFIGQTLHRRLDHSALPAGQVGIEVIEHPLRLPPGDDQLCAAHCRQMARNIGLRDAERLHQFAHAQTAFGHDQGQRPQSEAVTQYLEKICLVHNPLYIPPCVDVNFEMSICISE